MAILKSRKSLKFGLFCLIASVLFGVLTIVAHSSFGSFDHSVVGSKQETEDCKVVQHQLGATCIPKHAQRIAVLWSGMFGSALALGLQPSVITWDAGEPLPMYMQRKIGNGHRVEVLNWDINLEKLLQFKPDLILANTRLASIYPILSEIAPTVALEHARPPLPWQRTLSDIAEVFDREEVSQQLIHDYESRIETVKKKLGEKRHQLKISVITVNPPYGIFTYGRKHPTGALLYELGLQRPPMQTGDFITKDQISHELLSEVDGDYIFLSYRGGRSAKEYYEKLQNDPLWKSLKAVQQNRVYLVDSDHWYAFDVLAMNAVLDDLEKYLINTSQSSS